MKIRIKRRALSFILFSIFIIGIVLINSLFVINSPKKQSSTPATSSQKKSLPTPTPILDVVPFLYHSNISPDASEGARKAYREKITDVAVATKDIDISGCKPSPLISKIRQEEHIKFINEDKNSHEIYINNDTIFTVPPQKSVSVSANFGNGAGIYEFYCDNAPTPRGIILTLP